MLTAVGASISTRPGLRRDRRFDRQSRRVENFKPHFHTVQTDGMAQRNQLGRPFRGHGAHTPRTRSLWPLFDRESASTSLATCSRTRRPRARRWVISFAHIDHAARSGVIKMGKLRHTGSRSRRNECARGPRSLIPRTQAEISERPPRHRPCVGGLTAFALILCEAQSSAKAINPLGQAQWRR